MRPVSTGFINASLSPVGYADAYILINNTRINASAITEITINGNVGDSGAFAIGTFNTSEATMTVLTSALPSVVVGQPISIYFGYYVDGAFEYVPMGVFYAEQKDISHRNLFTTIRAQDFSWKLIDAYRTYLIYSSTPRTSTGYTILRVLQELQTILRETYPTFTIGMYGGANPNTVSIFEAPEGTNRNVIAQLALRLGCNAKMSRSGTLDFVRGYTDTSVQSYGPYDYTSSNFTIDSEQEVSFERVLVRYTYPNPSGEEQTDEIEWPRSYTPGGGRTIVINTNKYISSTETYALGQAAIGNNGFSHYGYSLTLPGQPHIDLGDTITVTSPMGETYTLPVLSVSHRFNGAMSSTFSATITDVDPTINGDDTRADMNQTTIMVDAVDFAKAKAQAAADQANAAAGSADRAAQSASAAATSASNAEASAQASAQSASNSEASAQASAQSASNSEASAQASAISAYNAEVSATESAQQARDASKYANAALDQLGVVEDVIGVLDWAKEHGSFVLTPDTEVQEGKVYFTYDSQTGDYTPVTYPEASALSTYYVLTVDEAMESFVMSHLAVTGRGLWVLPNGIGSGTTPATGESQEDSDARQGENYKVLIASDGFYVYDGAGVNVTTVGENITFNSTRPQYIGNETAYIAYDPKYNGSLTIGGATINLSGKTLTETLADLNDRSTQITKSVNNFKDLYEGYITIVPDPPEGPLITLGKTTSNNKVQITNEAVNFLSGSNTTAFASGQTFNAYEGRFETVMMQTMQGTGVLRWIARSNGHLSLKKVT